MTQQQQNRLECLNGKEFYTPDEDAEHAYLLRLESEARQAEEEAKRYTNEGAL